MQVFWKAAFPFRRAGLSLSLVGLLWGTMLVTACSPAGFPLTQTVSSSQTGQFVKIRVSRRLYPTLHALKQASDVVVVGTIVKRASVTTDQTGRLFTDFVLAVQQVVWESGHLVKSPQITLHQLGGMLGNAGMEVVDDPLFQVGQQVLLFLHRDSPGVYSVVGGPAGRYTVQDGVVNPVMVKGPHFTAGTSETAFILSIQKA